MIASHHESRTGRNRLAELAEVVLGDVAGHELAAELSIACASIEDLPKHAELSADAIEAGGAR